MVGCLQVRVRDASNVRPPDEERQHSRAKFALYTFFAPEESRREAVERMKSGPL